MASTGKKKRVMKRSVRKTLGSLFLASAIAVTAIPVENLQATVSRPSVSVDIENCRIPIVDEGETIYTTGDGMFQFAYVTTNDASSGNKVAVILGYDGGRRQGGILELPNTVDAYLKFSENLGTAYGYCAVGKSGNFLYYDTVVEKTDAFGNVLTEDDTTKPILDEEGNPTGTYEQKPIQEIKYRPCYYEDYAIWSQKDIADLYFDTGTKDSSGNPIYNKTTSATYQRIQDATVKYIGNQTLTAGTGTSAGTWSITAESAGGHIDTPSEGIFRGEKAGNVTTLIVGPDLSGIGDYAFSGCTGLESITLQNGLDTIGNHAFEKCVNLNAVNIDINAMLSTIGACAFEDCRALKNFTTPLQVTNIGDAAFRGCTSMSEIELCGKGKNVQLSKLGNDVFVNCSSLQSITFPEMYSESNLDLGMFEGCTSLKSITCINKNCNFDSGSDFDAFRETVPDTFYFEGARNGDLYNTAKTNSFAFKYIYEDIYEITERDSLGNQVAVYQVNSQNQLIYCEIKAGTEEVSIPGVIGPYGITTIDSTSFQNSCNLKKITIPSTITSIAQNAFKGCHNLKDVIFKEPVNLKSIGKDAFKTQDVYKSKCDAASGSCESNLDETPVLNFIGPISSDCVAFQYAMQEDSNINIDIQQRAYITYMSGWPTNLKVRYNPDTDKNELIDYLTFTELNTLTPTTYPYITGANITAAKQAYDKVMSHDDDVIATLTDGERKVLNGVFDLVLPDGIESIKKNLFVEKEALEDPTVEKSLSAYSLEDIDSKSFKGFSTLNEVSFYGGTRKVGDYAFEDCTNLKLVYFPETIQNLGIRPFKGCKNIENIYFMGESGFLCDNGIVFQVDSDGNKKKIIEYLEAPRSGVVTPEEVAGVSSVAEEAFMDTNVSFVDLRNTTIEEIPKQAFAETPKLSFLYLPRTWNTIGEDAFKNSGIQYLDIPGNLGYIDNTSFSGTTNSDKSLTFHCEENSAARRYAEQNDIRVTDKEIELIFKVHFWGYNNVFLETQEVKGGEDAVPPVPDPVEGYELVGWTPDYHGINRDIDITAIYEKEDPDKKKYIVTFVDYDGTVISTTKVLPGEDAEAPADPVRDGYQFAGWVPGITNIRENCTVVAQYISKDNRFTVRFMQNDGVTVLSSQLVDPGKDAILPNPPEKDGYRFTGWLPAPVKVTADMDCYAQYELIQNEYVDKRYTVRFIDSDGVTILSTQKVDVGMDPVIPQAPVKEGYTFTGWVPSPTGLTKDTDCYAQYEKGTSGGNGNTDGTGNGGNGGTGSGDNGNGGNGGTGSGDNGSGGNGGNGGTNTVLYSLTVKNGSGSGSYAAGSQPIIIANDPPSGQEFSHWTVDTNDFKIASTVLTATVVTMPQRDVTVTANYKAKSAGSNGGGSSSVSGNNSAKPGYTNSHNVTSSGTTVVIDKNGLSNTGVVSATVHGSSDNFTIKISESSTAAELAVRALVNEYGDISKITYFPMDISLYDASGKNMITDTSGLSISITVPLPDSMITYAGNNKVASVSTGKLEKLNAKFNTISGVACMTFTVEHFSPYVIYVDTNNLVAGQSPDWTPKTGDGIHPKWFLSGGLACASAFLFLKKDRRKKVKVAK